MSIGGRWRAEPERPDQTAHRRPRRVDVPNDAAERRLDVCAGRDRSPIRSARVASTGGEGVDRRVLERAMEGTCKEAIRRCPGILRSQVTTCEQNANSGAVAVASTRPAFARRPPSASSRQRQPPGPAGSSRPRGGDGRESRSFRTLDQELLKQPAGHRPGRLRLDDRTLYGFEVHDASER